MNINQDRIIFEALTYDDVLLLPGYSEILPRDTEIKTFLTRNIEVNIPFLSAAMDTVTESSMAISMALDGGIGLIHKNMTIAQQAIEVRKVKRSQSGMILDPITLNEKALAGDAEKIMRENNIGGIPVVNDQGILINIFGGIMRCDVLAQGVIDAAKEINLSVPLVVRLAGTNYKEGKEILDKSNLKILSASDLNDAAKKIVEAIE